jgi:hypothetical protein
MADETGGISTQGIKFVLSAEDVLSPALARADKAAAATAEKLAKAAEHISREHERHAVRTIKAVSTITDAHARLRKSAATIPVTKAVSTGAGTPMRLEDFLPSAGKTGPRIAFEKAVHETGSVVDFEKAKKAIGAAKGGPEKTLYGAAAPLSNFKIEKPEHFVRYQHAAKEMSEGLEKAFKKSEMTGLAFTRANKDQIQRLITEYKFFGQQVPKALDQAVKALDNYEKKVEEIGKKTRKSLMGTVEDFFQRLRKVEVGETIIGGAAFAAMMKLPQGYERAHRLGTEAARRTMMTEEQVFQRARDVLDVQTKTGAKMEEMHEINKALSLPGPVIASYKEAATAAFDLHRMTDLGAEAAGQMTRNMQQYYGVSGKGLDEQVAKTAVIAKNTLLSAKDQADLYDKLKFSGLAMSDNARAARGIAEGTTMAAAKMSQYGISVESVVDHVKGLTEGGVEEQAKGMQTLILGGMSPEEALDTLNQISEGSEEAIKTMEEYRGRAAATMGSMTAGAGAFGKAAGRKTLVDLGVAGTTGEAAQLTGMGRGVFADSQSQKALDTLEKGGPESAKLMADATREYRTATEERERAMEKAAASLYKTQEGTYKAILGASQAINTGADKFSNFVSGFTAAQLMGIGWATEFALAVVALKMTLPQFKTIFGMGGGGGALGGAGGAGGIAGGVGGAAGKAARQAELLGKFSAIVSAGMAGYAIGTFIDQWTEKVPFLKKAKDFTFDSIVEPFYKAADILTGKISAITGGTKLFEGTKTEGKTIEQLKAERKAKWGESAKPVPAAVPTAVAPATTAVPGLAPSHRATVSDISAIAAGIGATVTSTTGGAHNVGSAHYKGLAADIRTRGKSPEEIEEIKKVFQAAHYKVIDERFGAAKPGGVWSGPHLHVEATAAALAAEQVLASRGAMAPGAGAAVAAAAPVPAPYTGETTGDRGVISELRRATSILAQQLAVMQKNASGRNIPNVFSRETETINQGGMGG